MSLKSSRKWFFDPAVNDLVSETESTSDRVRHKLADPFCWCLCELCGQKTEFALAKSKQARGFFRRKKSHAKVFMPVELSDEMIQAGELAAKMIADQYRQTLSGESEVHPALFILHVVGADGWRELNSLELRDREEGYVLSPQFSDRITVENFQAYIESHLLMDIWSRCAEFEAAMPRHANVKTSHKSEPKRSRQGEPSKLYCARHNQGRSEEARRTYQRDMERTGEYQEVIAQIWSERAAEWPTWDIEAHAHVRQEAYRLLQELKPRQTRSSAGMIDELIEKGVTNQSEIARQLGVSRQAVSAAIKRHAQTAST